MSQMNQFLPSGSQGSKSNIILIGMPSAGKSTVGVLLAKRLGMDFLDTDILIQAKHGKQLQLLIKERGVDGFIDLEGDIVSSIHAKRTVIATGGSVVYSEKAMRSLGNNGIIIYLDVPFKEIKRRLYNIKTRGIAMEPGQSLQDLFNERTLLYNRFADLVIQWQQRMKSEDMIDVIVQKVEWKEAADGK